MSCLNAPIKKRGDEAAAVLERLEGASPRSNAGMTASQMTWMQVASNEKLEKMLVDMWMKFNRGMSKDERLQRTFQDRHQDRNKG